ncbi:hypothetical protein SFRURICE_007601 [Spodoptera frugiperda]|nr:hypothetical protein SFRURICE_007601 [Spodoptera frugiperda]
MNTRYPPHHENQPKTKTKCMSSVAKPIISFSRDFCKETSMHGFIHIAAPRRHWVERVAPCGNRTRYPLRGSQLPSHRTNRAVMMNTRYPSHHEKQPKTKTKCMSSMTKPIISFSKDFCKETRHQVSFSRLLWIVVTALCVWGALDVALGQLQRYNESPTVVTLEKDFRSWDFYLPALTLCFNAQAESPTRQPTDILHLDRVQEMEFGDWRPEQSRYVLIIMPDYVIKTKSSDDISYPWIPVMTEAGVCHTTNCLAVADVAVGPLKSNATADWPGSCAYASLSCFIITDIPANGRFYIHSPYDVMDLSVGWTDIRLTLVRTTELSVMESRCGAGVKDLSPSRRGCSYMDEPRLSGRKHTLLCKIKLSVMESRCGAGVKDLSPSRRGCSYMDEPRLSGRKVHSTNTCRLACSSQLAKDLCNCVPFYYFYDGGPPCTPKGMWCLAKNAHILLKNDERKCSCVPQCMDSSYKEMTIEEQVWKNPPFNQHGSIKYSVQAPQTRYTREIVFHFQDLVVSFGGAAGLFLGASFISFIEILYFVAARLFSHISGAEDNKNKSTATTLTQVKEAGVSHETLRIQYLTAVLMEDQKKYDSKQSQYYH